MSTDIMANHQSGYNNTKYKTTKKNKSMTQYFTTRSYEQ